MTSIVHYSLTGENVSAGGMGWEAVSDVPYREAPIGLEGDALYEQTFSGYGATAQEAVGNLIHNLREHGHSGVLRKYRGEFA